jgi:asparagine synthetase B (glutamine-hydrolysing)
VENVVLKYNFLIDYSTIRDDRCISDHGKEAWFPFLDEKVVRFLQETPLDLVNY